MIDRFSSWALLPCWSSDLLSQTDTTYEHPRLYFRPCSSGQAREDDCKIRAGVSRRGFESASTSHKPASHCCLFLYVSHRACDKKVGADQSQSTVVTQPGQNGTHSHHVYTTRAPASALQCLVRGSITPRLRAWGRSQKSLRGRRHRDKLAWSISDFSWTTIKCLSCNERVEKLGWLFQRVF